jgi:hypothetical protein
MMFLQQNVVQSVQAFSIYDMGLKDQVEDNEVYGVAD